MFVVTASAAEMPEAVVVASAVVVVSAALVVSQLYKVVRSFHCTLLDEPTLLHLDVGFGLARDWQT